MNCTDFEDRLHAQFGALRFDEAADLTDHAGQCPTCRMTLEQFRLLSDSLGVWRDQVPDVDLTDAVVAAWRSQKESSSSPGNNGQVVVPRREHAEIAPRTQSASQAGIIAHPFPFPGWFRSRRRTLWLAAGSLVGMLLFAVVLPGLLKTSSQEAADPQVVNVPERAHSQPPDHGQPQAVSPPVNNPPVAIPESDRDVYYDLAQKAAGALGEVAVYVMPGSSPPPMAPSDAGPEGAAGWIDGVKHQLQPIGRSLDDAFDFLWEAGQSADSSKT